MGYTCQFCGFTWHRPFICSCINTGLQGAVGTEITKILHNVGLKWGSVEGCGCASASAHLDVMGIEWCESEEGLAFAVHHLLKGEQALPMWRKVMAGITALGTETELAIELASCRDSEQQALVIVNTAISRAKVAQAELLEKVGSA